MADADFYNGWHALGNCELTGGQNGCMCYTQPIELGIGGVLSSFLSHYRGWKRKRLR